MLTKSKSKCICWFDPWREQDFVYFTFVLVFAVCLRAILPMRSQQERPLQPILRDLSSSAPYLPLPVLSTLLAKGALSIATAYTLAAREKPIPKTCFCFPWLWEKICTKQAKSQWSPPLCFTFITVHHGLSCFWEYFWQPWSQIQAVHHLLSSTAIWAQAAL